MKSVHTPVPDIKVNTLEKNKIYPGWVLTNFSNRELGVPVTTAVISPRGEIKWIYQRDDHPDLHGCIDVRTDREGVLIGGAHGRGPDAYFPVLVDWNQNVVWESKLANDPHHIHRRENGNFLLLTKEYTVVEEPEKHRVLSDVILEVNPTEDWPWETQEVDTIVWSWRLLDHLTPNVTRTDWAHCNTIEEDPENNKLYLSSRNLNSIFKIDRSTGEIEWRMGENGDFEMKKDDLFYSQHSPELRPDGNLLLFDNNDGPRSRPPEKQGRPRGEYSRAMELAIDEDEMTAESVWTWGEELDLFTPIWGDADRLPNGNTLITFGTRTQPKTSRIIEVTSDGERVLDIELLPTGWGMYRAEKLSEDILDQIPHTSHGGENF